MATYRLFFKLQYLEKETAFVAENYWVLNMYLKVCLSEVLHWNSSLSFSPMPENSAHKAITVERRNPSVGR